MNDDDLEQQLRKALYAIAPDIEGEPLDADVRYRDQFEFDSMDFLRFIMELHRPDWRGYSGERLPAAADPGRRHRLPAREGEPAGLNRAFCRQGRLGLRSGPHSG